MQTATKSRPAVTAAARTAAALKVTRSTAVKASKAVNVEALQLLVEEHEKNYAAARALYAKNNEINMEIMRLIGVETPVVLKNGRTLKVCDNFLDKNGNFKNVSYKPAGVRRFEFECE